MTVPHAIVIVAALSFAHCGGQEVGKLDAGGLQRLCTQRRSPTSRSAAC